MSREVDRYRRVTTRMWGDAKFRTLSAPPPNAQTLWQWLITGPYSNAIPGLLRVGEMTIAEDLGWPLEDTRACISEIESQGMAIVDRKSRVIFLPRAIAHNPPQSVNVVKAWRTALREVLPECELVQHALCVIREYLEKSNSPFAKAYVEACVKASPLPCAIQESGYRNQDTGSRKQDQSAREPETPPDNFEASIVTAWNENTAPLPRAPLLLAASEKEFLKARRAEYPDLAFWTALAERVKKALAHHTKDEPAFLVRKKGGPATLAWFLADSERITKLFAGAFDDAPTKKEPKAKGSDSYNPATDPKASGAVWLEQVANAKRNATAPPKPLSELMAEMKLLEVDKK